MLHLIDGVAQKFISVLDADIFKLDGILRTVLHAILIYVYGIILRIAQENGVPLDVANELGDLPCASTGAKQSEDDSQRDGTFECSR